VLQLGDQARQRDLGRRRREDEQELLAQVTEEAQDRHPGNGPEDRAEDDEHEDEARGVEAEHHLGEALQSLHAGRAHEGGDRAERADRGDPHDHRQHLEDDGLGRRDGLEHRLAPSTETLDREPDQERDEQGLQHHA
jgi:hypothetical protein